MCTHECLCVREKEFKKKETDEVKRIKKETKNECDRGVWEREDVCLVSTN